METQASLISPNGGPDHTDSAGRQEIITNNSSPDNSHNKTTKTITILLPDLFISWAAITVEPNPHYSLVKAEVEETLKNIYHFNEQQMRRFHKGDFTLYAAAIAPTIGLEGYRTFADMIIWGFLFDDQFDEGHLRNDLALARQEVDISLSIMTSDPDSRIYKADTHPIRHLLRGIWVRVAEKSSPDAQKRFVATMQNYMEGVLSQVYVGISAVTLSPEEYLLNRRKTVGIQVYFSLFEYGYGLEIPAYVFEDPAVQTLENLLLDIVALQNDIASYKKEQLRGETHNIIAILSTEGNFKQSVFNRANKLYKDCFKKWYVAQSEIPIWGEEIDGKVQKYMECIQNIARGTLYHTFNCDRYFGKEKGVVRKTRVVELLG